MSPPNVVESAESGIDAELQRLLVDLVVIDSVNPISFQPQPM